MNDDENAALAGAELSGILERSNTATGGETEKESERGGDGKTQKRKQRREDDDEARLSAAVCHSGA